MGWVDLIVDVARKAEHQLGGLGPFTPEEAGALPPMRSSAEKAVSARSREEGLAVRQALRRVGDLIRIAEAASSKR
jgi:hypothetical protein